MHILDGVMIQLLPEKMAALKEALKAVEDFRISCGASSPAKHAAESVEQDTVSFCLQNRCLTVCGMPLKR